MWAGRTAPALPTTDKTRYGIWEFPKISVTEGVKDTLNKGFGTFDEVQFGYDVWERAIFCYGFWGEGAKFAPWHGVEVAKMYKALAAGIM